MDTFGFDKSVLINLQLEHIKNQFNNACCRLNIYANFQKPTEQWLSNNIRGNFKSNNCNTGFLYEGNYVMQWGLYLDKGDVHFTVIYDRDVFRAIEPFFNIQEIDEDIIVGNYEMQRNAPLPLKKDVSFLSEDLTIRVNGREKRSMPDARGNLFFGDLSQRCNWTLNILPALPASQSQAVVTPTANVSYNLAVPEASTKGSDPADSEPLLHSVVSQRINKFNLRHFNPSIPPPTQPAHCAQTAGSTAGPSAGHRDLSEKTGNGNNGKIYRESRKQKKKILPNSDNADSSSEISSVPSAPSNPRKKMPKPKEASTPKKRVHEHEYDSISETSGNEQQKLCKEFQKVFKVALRGREKDPLSEFLIESVPKVFEFLSLRENAPLNDSGHQEREEHFVQNIDKIYQSTKEAIIRNNQRFDFNQSQQEQSHTNNSNNSIILPLDIQETTIKPSNENIVTAPSEIITRSKSKTRLDNAE